MILYEGNPYLRIPPCGADTALEKGLRESRNDTAYLSVFLGGQVQRSWLNDVMRNSPEKCIAAENPDKSDANPILLNSFQLLKWMAQSA